MIPDWLSLSTTAGTGSVTVTVTASSYSEILERSASLKISTANKSAYVTVQQRLDSSFRIIPNSLTLSQESQEIEIISDTPWTATSYPAWITLSADSGSGDTVVSATSTETGTTIKRGSIKFVDDRGYERTVSTTYVPSISPEPSEYLTFTMLGDGEIKYTMGTSPYISYSKDGGATWHIDETIPVSAGDTVIFTGNSTDYRSQRIRSDAPHIISGKLESLCQDAHTGRFGGFFSGDMGLVSAENLILPSTIAFNNSFESLFAGCENLVIAPKELPALVLTESCYEGMFAGCRSLVTAPKLPASTAWRCYDNMFAGCVSLIEAPDLPAEILSYACYYEMFKGCTGLTSSPVLPAEVVPEYGYFRMFYGCTNLSSITCLATDITSHEPTEDWTYGVSSAGTFYKSEDMESWTTGEDGIPTGWMVVDYEPPTPPTPPTPPSEYLAFTMAESGHIVFKTLAAYPDPPNRTILYSKDNGTTWGSLTSSSGGTSISVLGGEVVLFSGNNTTYRYANLTSTAQHTVSGSLNALIKGGNITSYYCFSRLFDSSTGLVSASGLTLPSNTTNNCYEYMFRGCTSLTSVPVLPATGLSNYCYLGMFGSCTSLTTAPVLSATTLVSSCYSSMFAGCENLQYIKCLATDISASYCLNSWVNGVSASGTFVKATGITYPEGNSGIPSGWTVVEE